MQSNPKNITRFTSNISKNTSKFTSKTNQNRLGGCHGAWAPGMDTDGWASWAALVSWALGLGPTQWWCDPGIGLVDPTKVQAHEGPKAHGPRGNTLSRGSQGQYFPLFPR